VSLFVFVGWLICAVTATLLAAVLVHYRYLVLKPSIVVLCTYHLTIQWAAAVQAPAIERWLPAPWDFLLLAHGFPLVGLLVSIFLASRSAAELWSRVCRRPLVSCPRVRRRAIIVLTSMVLGSTALYLKAVPLTSTGLYAILADPIGLHAAQAREDSLKLVGSALVRYSYSFMINALAPLLAVLIAAAVPGELRRRRFRRLAATVAAVCGILAVVSFSGARANAAAVILAILLGYFLVRGVPLRGRYIVLSGLAVLSLPTILTVLREGATLDLPTFWRYLSAGIFRRVFVIPMEMGLWHVHFAQTQGFFGVAGLQRFAPWFGLEPLNVANIVARAYAPQELPTTLANCSYVFSYYSYFNLWSLPVSLVGLWLLDGALFVYRRLGDDLLVPCIASVSISALTFVNVDYLLVLVTNGFLILLGVSWGLQRLGDLRVRLTRDGKPSSPVGQRQSTRPAT
jgi:hypothetical protein